MPNDMPHPSPSVAAEDTRSVFDRVFGTYELCENILKDLALGDLLSTRRMCRATESLVRNSITLRRKLFLTPTDESYTTWHIDEADRLILGPAPKEKELTENTFVCTYTPLIVDVCRDTANEGLKGCSCNDNLTCRIYQLNFDPGLLTDGSSCGAMFLTQPPTTQIVWWANLADFELSGGIEDIDGVRFGDLVKDVNRVATAKGVESLEGLRELSWPFDKDCAVTAEQKLFVERMGVVAPEADPWLLESKAWEKQRRREKRLRQKGRRLAVATGLAGDLR
ncbi:hypothetical protein LTR10_001807 [Elasticomyces elasticus]|nr:hypothetical protein LTR10_001807 [Elasticomyces elasticus]KAK4975305.1 hypothetical protein LTR42_004515 [Elasticomyces elasticus]